MMVAHRGINPLCQPPHIVRKQGLQKIRGAAACDEDLAHMGYVENAGPFAHGAMLRQDTFILQGHSPAVKIGHLRAQRDVFSVQRRLHTASSPPAAQRGELSVPWNGKKVKGPANKFAQLSLDMVYSR